ncbi:MAG: hypothetical protein US86_C0001G0018 [Candidatus Daviesbacteria bacterium GW2011_GWA2_38_24]|uniref:YdeN-like protein n=1 Tax=Candidatus Daviesbacteria bacterium GW2011_GWA2_38_24 TaxID=1618422 RepID=A0A0G0MQB0_9BACT|nr:MAG: hypothetical protein US86_C0001G0018 [Candidatus Daviesbacteria bacterium GW2011_GWA2_38_24]KKQ80948.1 MAG: hypothetical protein UT01_C0003G0015 [Candidatus Daviesbacteria bacterium GW2011_GWA1_38_7]OGE22864.1 MAG: hypothetical protein A2688_04500 [Candidatus Daviesbacteria bacterium RIFCSPHIGHO2_01_FULL_38_8]
MKRVVIVHCWEGYPKYCWYPEVKKELEDEGFEVKVPAMPETDFPKLFLWIPKLKEIADEPSEDLYLIGHSVGVITILRYLEHLEEGKKVGGVVMVAGFTDDLDYEELKNFFETPIDFEKIKTKSKHFTAIHSDNDPYVSLRHGDIFKEKLGAELIVKYNMGHFSGPVDDTKSVTSLPEVVEAIKETSGE